jgi:acetoin utilization deacetylase AcuC-like enzyme
MGKIAYLYDPIFLEHDTGWGHPECPERLIAIETKLQSNPIYASLVRVKAQPAEYRHIELIHDRAYIERAKTEIEGGVEYFDSMDTTVCPRSFQVALHAAGGCINMCDTVMRGDANYGFCAVRPPGHHAERNYSAGFCIFNNIAIMARYLQKEHGVKKVAIVDWDVHHGNGTQHSFEDDNSVLYISTHQYPYYPGTGDRRETGTGKGKGDTLNLAMDAGSGDDEYRVAFTEEVIDGIDDFEPDFILISAGFDAHRADPLSSIQISSKMYYIFTKMLVQLAKKYTNDRIIAVLEGGYHLGALAESVDLMMNAFNEG